MKVITTRIEDKCFEDLKQIEKDEKREIASIMRTLLAESIKQWKIKKALSLLREHKVTISRAAAIADIPYSEMFDLMAKAEIDIGYTVEDLRNDLKK